MQNELRWALIAIGAALIIMVVMAMKIKRRNKAGLRDFEDDAWQAESDALLDSSDELIDDVPTLEAVQKVIRTEQVEPTSEVPHVSAEVVKPVDSASEPVDSVETLRKQNVTPGEQAVPIRAVPEFLKEGRDVTVPSVHDIDEAFSHSGAVQNASYSYPDSISTVMGESGHEVSDVKMALDALHDAPRSANDRLDSHVLNNTTENDQQEATSLTQELNLDEGVTDFAHESQHLGTPDPEQGSLDFDPDFEDQVKRRIKKIPPLHASIESEPKASPVEMKPRYSSVESYSEAEHDQTEQAKFEPRYSAVKELSETKDSQTESEQIEDQPVIVKEPAEPHVIVIHIKCSDSVGFYGLKIAKALSDIGMKFGDFGIYHYKSSGKTIFSVANMVKPGIFEPKKFSQFTTPGLSLFASVAQDSDFAFVQEVVEKSAEYIASQLHGGLSDAEHNTIHHLDAYVAEQMDLAKLKFK